MMTLVSCVDGHFHPKEMEEISQVCRDLLEAPKLTEELSQHVAGRAKLLKSDAVLTLLSYSRGFLNSVGRENVFIAALRVARADKCLHPKEVSLLFEIGEALGLRPSRIKEIIEANG
jgi:tellurite resistance protein